MQLIVVGGGGHAKVLVELCRAAGHSVVGVLDPALTTQSVLGAPVLGGDEKLPALRADGVEGAVIALGSNRLRQRLGRQCDTMGFAMPSVIHSSALLAPSARVGPGAVLMAGCIVGTETRVEAWAIVNTGAIIDHDGLIGEAAHVAPGCALAGCVTVGRRVLIGVGTSIIPQVTIGDDAVVGGGSSVIADVPPAAMVGGTPARPLRRHPA